MNHPTTTAVSQGGLRGDRRVTTTRSREQEWGPSLALPGGQGRAYANTVVRDPLITFAVWTAHVTAMRFFMMIS
jgi:hypothetical protein